MSGASLNQPELEAAIAGWIAMGFEVIRASDTVLLLDIDNEYAQAQYDRVFPCVQEHFAPVNVERWTSKSGNTHIRITLPTPQPWEIRYALEAMLGSDGMRGTLGILQMLNGCDEASMLVRPIKQPEAVDEQPF